MNLPLRQQIQTIEYVPNGVFGFNFNSASTVPFGTGIIVGDDIDFHK